MLCTYFTKTMRPPLSLTASQLSGSEPEILTGLSLMAAASQLFACASQSVRKRSPVGMIPLAHIAARNQHARGSSLMVLGSKIPQRYCAS